MFISLIFPIYMFESNTKNKLNIEILELMSKHKKRVLSSNKS